MTESQDQEAGEAEILVGERLRAAREAEGLTAQDLAARLCLGVRQVEALENGELAKLPGKTFVRGVVRGYAALVRLEAAPLLDLLDQVKGLTSPMLALPESTHVIMPTGQSIPGNRNLQAILAGLALVVVAVILYFVAPYLNLAGFFSSDGDVPGVESAPLKTDPAPLPEALSTSAPSRSAPDDSVSPVSMSAPRLASSGQRSLQFLFSGESWVEVRDRDDKVLVSGRFAVGQTQSVSGMPPFSVTVGDVAQVRLYDDGKQVSLPASGVNRVARLRLP
ncbi:MAG: DUF4115 domain-containing protein [Zoogloeaceae bacterium]|jgi:cytoskeleton protein RodZ|nr:DUF4115 domain-containing protein [Zoogloeaceae bacterium]